MGARVVLFVIASDDEHPSTADLLDVVEVMNADPAAEAVVWYLRAGDLPVGDRTTRVVDHLRTWPLAVLLDRCKLGVLADRLRGQRLRRWYRTVAPDAVVLDGGGGARVLPRRSRVPVIHRLPGAPAFEEVRGGGGHDAVLVASTHTGPSSGVPWLVLPPMRGLDEALAMADPDAKASAREAHGLPLTGTLLASWSAVATGPEVLIRALRATSDGHREGVVHGLWACGSITPAEAEHIRALADLAGVGDRFHLRTYDGPSTRLAADIVVLGSDVRAADALELAELEAAGVAAWFLDDTGPRPETVPDLGRADRSPWAKGSAPLDREPAAWTVSFLSLLSELCD